MQVWNVLHVSLWKSRTQKIAKKSPSAHHRTTLSGYIFATKTCIDNRKETVKQQYLLQMFHNMANFGPLTAEIGWRFGAPMGNFNAFRVLASLLQRSRSTQAKQTLHDAWPSPGLVHCIYIFGGLLPLAEVCQVQIHFASKSCVLLYWQCDCTALDQRALPKLCGVVQWMEFNQSINQSIYLSINHFHKVKRQ